MGRLHGDASHWLLAIGFWLLAIGCWLLVVGVGSYLEDHPLKILRQVTNGCLCYFLLGRD
jgi:hypothetical protein